MATTTTEAADDKLHHLIPVLRLSSSSNNHHHTDGQTLLMSQDDISNQQFPKRPPNAIHTEANITTKSAIATTFIRILIVAAINVNTPLF
mmetsp:Transcript_24137/g.67295  ORF Transcript_24137/g.67295 Transcript_24137/m.67295 type:complete len:90 (-) Transcript_24137:30-299(-)